MSRDIPNCLDTKLSVCTAFFLSSFLCLLFIEVHLIRTFFLSFFLSNLLLITSSRPFDTQRFPLPPRNFPLSDFRLIFLSRHSRWLPSDSLCWYVVCGEISWRLVSASLTEQIQTLTDGSVAKTAKTNGPTRIKQIAPAKPRGRAG